VPPAESGGHPAQPDRRLTIKLDRLPDIHSLQAAGEHGYDRYGRFAVLRGGGFWFADTVSSHPTDTATGWYWAIDAAGRLLVSARGAGVDGEALFTTRKPVLALLVEALVDRRYIRAPTGIRLDTGG